MTKVCLVVGEVYSQGQDVEDDSGKLQVADGEAARPWVVLEAKDNIRWPLD